MDYLPAQVKKSCLAIGLSPVQVDKPCLVIGLSPVQIDKACGQITSLRELSPIQVDTPQAFGYIFRYRWRNPVTSFRGLSPVQVDKPLAFLVYPIQVDKPITFEHFLLNRWTIHYLSWVSSLTGGQSTLFCGLSPVQVDNPLAFVGYLHV